MTSSTPDQTATDPQRMTAASWSARYAALRSRNVTDADPRAAECLAALSFWRLKRTIDAEVEGGHMTEAFGEAITEKLRDEAVQTIAAAVTA